jgi:hypothetical protein
MSAVKLRSLFIAVCGLSVSGCAGVVTAWKNDPLQSYDVIGPSIYTMTGDRRTAVFTRKDADLRYCAESLPDAVAAFAASSSAKLKAEGLRNGAGGEVGISDQASAALLQTFQRTEIAEVSRQLGFNTCLAWSQGAITSPEYHALLQDIVAGTIEVMKTRAGQPLPPPPLTTIQILPAPTPSSTSTSSPES